MTWVFTADLPASLRRPLSPLSPPCPSSPTSSPPSPLSPPVLASRLLPLLVSPPLRPVTLFYPLLATLLVERRGGGSG